MLPQIGLDRTAVPVEVPPPPHFHPLHGTPGNVRFRSSGAEGSRGLTAAQKAGLRYEAKAQDYLSKVLGGLYHVAPYLHFTDLSGSRTVVPDGLYLNDGEAIVFEIKISHMPDAWWQLRRLYQPVVERLSYVHSVSVIEVVRSFDPSQAFPEEVKVIRGLDGLVSSPNFRVLLWRP